MTHTTYTKTTDFAAKDDKLTGDPLKVIVGTEHDVEFNNIVVAVNTKADLAGPALTGTTTAVNLTVSGTLNSTGTLQIGGVAVTSTAAELNILDGVTSTAAELNILDGVTSTTAELNILDGVTSTAAELNILDGVTATYVELNLMDGVTATTAELNYTDGVTSAIQTQLDSKVGVSGNTFTGTTTVSGKAIFGAEIVEETFSIPSSTTPELDPADGTVQYWTLTGTSTPTDVLADGEYITIKILDGSANTIDWTSVLAAANWVGGSAPTLDTTLSNWIELWNVAGTNYGALVGTTT